MTRSALPRSVALAALVALVLCGCAPSDAPSPTTQVAVTPKPTPMFASDEEALKAATEVYRKYVIALTDIYHTGKWSQAAISLYATADYAAESEAEFRELTAGGIHTTGSIRLVSTAKQSVRVTDGDAEVTIYVCADVTNYRVLNATGEDVTPPGRQQLQSSVVTLNASSTPTLKVSKAEAWSGSSVC